jgi:cytoskeletal protein RodZ
MTFPAYGTYPTIGQPDDEPKKPSVPLSEIAAAQVLLAKRDAERMFGGQAAFDAEQVRDNARREEMSADVDRSLPPGLKQAIAEAAAAQASAEQTAQTAQQQLRAHLSTRPAAAAVPAYATEKRRLEDEAAEYTRIAREAATAHGAARERNLRALQQGWWSRRDADRQTLERTRQRNTERYNTAVLALQQLETDIATEDRRLAEAVNEWDRLEPWQ